MYTVGLDLAVQAAHKAVVVDERGRFTTPVLTLHTRAEELDQLLTRARNGVPDAAVQVVMEPTGMAWFPVAAYLLRHDITVYLVNSQRLCGKASGAIVSQASEHNTAHGDVDPGFFAAGEYFIVF